MASGASEARASMATMPGVTERYFTRWYKPDVKGNQCEDHCILQHSNRICVITIADAHPLLQKKNQLRVLIIRLVQTATGCKIKFLESLNGMPLLAKHFISRPILKMGTVSKKRSMRGWPLFGMSAHTHGAQFLTELAPLCRILCLDGEEYTIYSCIRGKLIEVNENILENPSLLQEKPSTEGYIAVVLPKFEESKKVTQGLLTREEYEEFMSKRFNSTSLCNTKKENSAEV